MQRKILMSAKEYHEAEGIGSTLVKAVAKQTVIHALEAPFEGSKYSETGAGLHTKILDPETFDNDFLVAPKVDRRTARGKEVYNEFMDKAKGRTVLDDEQMEAIKSMSLSVLNHPTAQYMLKGGTAEYSYFVECPETGLKLKCRPDYENKNTLIDIKSTRDASPKGFARQSANLLYYVQAAYYLDVYNLANHTNIKEFYFIAVENTAPWGCCVHKVKEYDIEYGREIYRKALLDIKKYREESKCKDFKRDNFIYGTGILELELPPWAYSA